LKSALIVNPYDIDGTADALAAIETGEMSQTIFQNAKGQAESAFQVVQGMMKGEAPPTEKLVPFESITKENVAKYKK
jgi:inositol transport system substrate-binding protein